MVICRASVQIVEFVRLAGGDSKICEYNQEACRLDAFDGRKSLVRSFPSKVGVSAPATQTRAGGGGGRESAAAEEPTRLRHLPRTRPPKARRLVQPCAPRCRCRCRCSRAR